MSLESEKTTKQLSDELQINYTTVYSSQTASKEQDMSIWFTSDQHFWHARILEHMPETRPFNTIEDMNAKLIENWNRVVQPNDTVYHLGDFAFREKRGDLEPIFAQLNGVKHLVAGNHDSKHVRALPWASQQDYKEIKIDGRHIVLFHYAIMEWNRNRYGTIHLHGHHHGTLEPRPRCIDVGADVWNLTPVSFEQIYLSRVKTCDELGREDQ